MDKNETPLWARQLHNLLLLSENGRDENECRLFANAACQAMRRHLREQYGLADGYEHRRRKGEGHGSRASAEPVVVKR